MSNQHQSSTIEIDFSGHEDCEHSMTASVILLECVERILRATDQDSRFAPAMSSGFIMGLDLMVQHPEYGRALRDAIVSSLSDQDLDRDAECLLSKMLPKVMPIREVTMPEKNPAERLKQLVPATHDHAEGFPKHEHPDGEPPVRTVDS